MHSYQLYLLHSPSALPQHGECQHLFGELLALRIRGYVREHGPGVMPVDAYDHFSTHLLLCQDGQPVACAKFIPFLDCQSQQRAFPPGELLERAGNQPAQQATEAFIRRLIARNLDLTYDCAFTLCPTIRQSQEAATIVRIMHGAWMCYHHSVGPRHFIVSATLRLKTERLFLRLGCQPVCKQAEYRLHSVNNEPALMMCFEQGSPLAQSWIAQYRPLWEQRRELGLPHASFSQAI